MGWRINNGGKLFRFLIISLIFPCFFFILLNSLCGHWHLCFRLLVTSAQVFKARVDSLACLLLHLRPTESSDSPLMRHLLTYCVFFFWILELWWNFVISEIVLLILSGKLGPSSCAFRVNVKSVPVADLHTKILDPPRSNFFTFHAVLGESWPNNRLVPPPLGLATPLLVNPGSAAVFGRLHWPSFIDLI